MAKKKIKSLSYCSYSFTLFFTHFALESKHSHVLFILCTAVSPSSGSRLETESYLYEENSIQRIVMQVVEKNITHHFIRTVSGRWLAHCLSPPNVLTPHLRPSRIWITLCDDSSTTAKGKDRKSRMKYLQGSDYRRGRPTPPPPSTWEDKEKMMGLNSVWKLEAGPGRAETAPPPPRLRWHWYLRGSPERLVLIK